jgi:hypothetical protein
MSARASARRIVAATLLLAGCATLPTRDRVAHLASESYACGAAEGLGCGLALAPVLRAIDAVEGVAESRVAWDGRAFRIELMPGADAERVTAAAAAVLEGASRRIAASELTDGVDKRWLDAEQTVQLSRFEAGVIAADLSADIAAEVTLDAETRRRLDAVVGEEVERAFERAHAAGGGVHRLWEQLPLARFEFERRTSFLTPAQRAAIEVVFDRRFEG